MHFLSTLAKLHPAQRLSLNYQYPLATAVFKITQWTNEGYTSFLDGLGSRYGGKFFKCFKFSDLCTPFYRRRPIRIDFKYGFTYYLFSCARGGWSLPPKQTHSWFLMILAALRLACRVK